LGNHQPKSRAELASLLEVIGLSIECVEILIGVGAAESRTFSRAAPLAASEYMRWARMVEHFQLESTAQGLGWLRYNPQNLPVFVHPKTQIGLVISSGDEYTGVSFANPSTRNPKGTSFARTIDPDGQLAFFGTLDDEAEMIEVSDMRVLLYQERGGLVFTELSRPSIVHAGRIVAWDDRVIFPAFDVSANRFVIDDGDTEADFTFTIARR